MIRRDDRPMRGESFLGLLLSLLIVAAATAALHPRGRPPAPAEPGVAPDATAAPAAIGPPAP